MQCPNPSLPKMNWFPTSSPCQLVIKQILDVIDVIAPVEVRDKMASQLKSIDFSGHPSADPVTLRAIQKSGGAN
ncbi:Protein of uncharacterised function (DUF2766) [Cronobacter sakazakii]|nr:Protein of uncharacterised function (DUF2766) [Cronobacter sakazakii]